MKTWQEYMERRVKGHEKNVPAFLFDKLKCHNFCRDLGFRTANIIDIFDSPDDIKLDNLDHRTFVLKPTLDSSTRGVMIIEKNHEGFYDHLRKEQFSFDEIIEFQRRYFEENKHPDNKIIVEEKLQEFEHSGIPRDYKAYTFLGQIALILAIDRNSSPAVVTWYDSNFEVVTDSRITCNPKYVKLAENPRIPTRWREILALARTASLCVNTPFSSIDMYSTQVGPVIGEISLTPGGIYYGLHYQLSQKQQILMGNMWTDAEMRLNNQK